MRKLADYILQVGTERFAASAPIAGDLSRSSSSSGKTAARGQVTLGVTASDVSRLSALIGREARLLTNIANPRQEVGKLTILKVDSAIALLVGVLRFAELRVKPQRGSVCSGDGVGSTSAFATLRVPAALGRA